MTLAEQQGQWAWTYVNRNFPNWNAKKKKNNETNKTEYPKMLWQLWKECDMPNDSTRQKKERQTRGNVHTNNSWKVSKINDRHKVTDPGSSENTKQNKYPQNLQLGIFKLEKKNPKAKKKSW